MFVPEVSGGSWEGDVVVTGDPSLILDDPPRPRTEIYRFN